MRGSGVEWITVGGRAGLAPRGAGMFVDQEGRKPRMESCPMTILNRDDESFVKRVYRNDLEKLGNGLELSLVEVTLARFRYVGRNRCSYNRIFLVIDEHGGDNFIHDYTHEQHLPMRRGMIYFMPGNTDLGFSFNPDMRFIALHFHLEMFGYLNIFGMRMACSEKSDESGIIDRLAAIVDASGWKPSGLCHLRGMVLQLAGDFLDAGGCPEIDRLNDMNNRHGILFEYIRDHANAQTSIDELAKVAGISRDSLSREFSQDCGITLKQYLNRAITRKAEHLLLSPGATARNVAEKLRFNNEYYFSRFFKKHTGLTTMKYRTQIRMTST